MDADPDPEANQVIFQLILLTCLTLVNAFFSAAEMAIVSVNKNKIKRLACDGDKNAILIEHLFDNSTKFLSTIQVAITLAGFFSSASAATGISQMLGIWLKARNTPYSGTVAVVVVTIILSYFMLVFGELVPKKIAMQKAEVISLSTVRPIMIISKMLFPFIKLLSISTNLFLRVIGMKVNAEQEMVSEEEIREMLRTGNEGGVFDDVAQKRINSIFLFDDKLARDIMIPRMEVFAMDIEEPLEHYIDELLESRYNRIPVYSGDVDNIVGILNIKDFMIEARKSCYEEIDVSTILQKAYLVPETKKTDVLFRELQKTKNHMAILIDEYGGFAGIVTVEDLVEEIMGDINDEYDLVEPECKKLGDNSYMVEGGMDIEDLNEFLGVELESKNYDTVSGYLIEHMGYIPDKDDSSVIQVGNITFKVQKIKEKRIDKVMLLIG